MVADPMQVEKSKVRDPRWLRVDICKDHMAGKCRRQTSECRFAHPFPNCTVDNNKVTVCYDSMRNRCKREFCKFYHPPCHIKEYLLAFGKALENERLQKEQSTAFPHAVNGMQQYDARRSSGSASSESSMAMSYARETCEGECATYTLRRISNVGQQSENVLIYDCPQQALVSPGQGFVYHVPPPHQPNFQAPYTVFCRSMVPSHAHYPKLVVQSNAMPANGSYNGGIAYQTMQVHSPPYATASEPMYLYTPLSGVPAAAYMPEAVPAYPNAACLNLLPALYEPARYGS